MIQQQLTKGPIMKMIHSDSWLSRSQTFSVEITRHADTTGNKWCLYAYIYPTHPIFESLSENLQCDNPDIVALNLHGGCTYVHGSNTQCVKFGCDYSHWCDDRFKHFRRLLEEATEIFSDAEDLFNNLTAMEAQEHTMKTTITIDKREYDRLLKVLLIVDTRCARSSCPYDSGVDLTLYHDGCPPWCSINTSDVHGSVGCSGSNNERGCWTNYYTDRLRAAPNADEANL